MPEGQLRREHKGVEIFGSSQCQDWSLVKKDTNPKIIFNRVMQTRAKKTLKLFLFLISESGPL